MAANDDPAPIERLLLTLGPDNFDERISVIGCELVWRLGSALLGTLGVSLGGKTTKNVAVVGLMGEGVILLFFELDELVHCAEHVALLIVEEPIEGLIFELHVLLYTYLHVLSLVQFAKVADHVFSEQFLLQHCSIFVPDDVVLFELVNALSCQLLPSPFVDLRSYVVDVAVNQI